MDGAPLTYHYFMKRKPNLRTVVCICVLSFVFAGGLIAAIAIPLAQQNADRTTTYRIWADYDPSSQTLQVTQNVVYYNDAADSLERLSLNFYPFAFENGKRLPVCDEEIPDCYPDGVSYSAARFDSASASPAAVFTENRTDNLLEFQFDEPIPRGRAIRMNFTYVLTLPDCKLRYGYSENTVRLANFYPQICHYRDGNPVAEDYSPYGDPMLSDPADYTVTLCYPQDYEAVSSGKTDYDRQDGWITMNAQANGIRDYAAVLAYGAHIARSRQGDIELAYLYTEDDTPDLTLEIAARALKLYGEWYGNYPLKTFSLARIPFCAGGMEYGGLVYLSDELSDSANETTIAHETAHQWWYGAVGSDPFTNAWQDEGLAQYSVFRYYRARDMAQYADDFAFRMISDYAAFAQIQQNVGEPIGGQLSLPLSQVRSQAHYVNVAYHKGFAIFRYAQKLMGEQKLQAALCDYAQRMHGRVANPQDLWDALDRQSNGVSEVLLTFSAEY